MKYKTADLEGVQLDVAEEAFLKTCKAMEFTHDATVVRVADAMEYARQCMVAEREACAELADKHEADWYNPANVIAEAIRLRANIEKDETT